MTPNGDSDRIIDADAGSWASLVSAALPRRMILPDKINRQIDKSAIEFFFPSQVSLVLVGFLLSRSAFN